MFILFGSDIWILREKKNKTNPQEINDRKFKKGKIRINSHLKQPQIIFKIQELNEFFVILHCHILM